MATWRHQGLTVNDRADDLIIEENETVIAAVKRLTQQEQYDRVYRLRRAVQLSVRHKLLPRDEWTKPEEDQPYLVPLIEELKAAEKEKEDLDTISVIRNH